MFDPVIIRTLASSSLGQSATKHSISLFIDVSLVLAGLKPAFLVDRICTDATRLKTFVSNVYEQLAAETDLHPLVTLGPVKILDIASDLVIIRVDRLRTLQIKLATCGSDSQIKASFIDVSAKLDRPTNLPENELMRLLMWMAQVLLLAEDNQDDAVGILTIDSHQPSNDSLVCIPALFGILLGYPCVYFVRPEELECMDGEGGSTNSGPDNCLGGVPLTLVSVWGHLSDYKHLCLSFTIPTHLYQSHMLDPLAKFKVGLLTVFHDVDFLIERTVQQQISL